MANKQDKLWIKWTHEYYIKDNSIYSIPIPPQASWMVRKIIAARSILSNTQIDHQPSICIKTIYQKLLGDNARVTWRSLVFDNSARPKARFTMWLQLQNRLLTNDRLYVGNRRGSTMLCQQHLETWDHLFVQCPFSQSVWRRIMKWLQWQWRPTKNWDNHLEWTIALSKGRSINASFEHSE